MSRLSTNFTTIDLLFFSFVTNLSTKISITFNQVFMHLCYFSTFFNRPVVFVYLYFQWFGKFTLEFKRCEIVYKTIEYCVYSRPTRIWLLKLDAVFFVVLKWKRNRSESGWHGSRSVQQNLAVGPARPRQGRLGSSGSSTRWASADQHSSSEIIILQSAAITATSRCADCRPL